MTVDELLFRCSSLGLIMPADNAKTDFTVACKDSLVEIYNSLLHGRTEEDTNKFQEKGTAQEELAITLLALNKGKNFTKNEQHFKNKFISGTPDIIDRLVTHKETYDTKCSWSKNTFDKSRLKSANALNRFQGFGYMSLTNATRHTVVHCLVNGTAKQIEREKHLLAYQDISDARDIELCKQIERNHIFDMKQFLSDNEETFLFDSDISAWCWDIPKNKRVHEFVIERDEEIIKKIELRVVECRKWIMENLI